MVTFRRLLALSSVICLGLLAAVPAGATSPEEPRAEIVFANGGRIVSIEADGSNRRVLTRKNGPVVAERSWDAFVPVEDSRPSISPDGTMLLFQRDRDLKGLNRSSSIVVANRDGSGQKEIATWKNAGVNWLAWSPDNRVLVGRSKWDFTDRKEVDRYWTISMTTEGTDREVLIGMTFREKDFLSYNNFLATHMTPVDISPDGNSLLYVVGTGRQNELWVLGSRGRLLLKRGVDDAAFSPDGTSIVFESGTCRTGDGEVCDVRKPGPWIAQANGFNSRRLIGAIGGASDLDWSADGSTIIFSSYRNFPGAGELASEIYSVAADGICLSWLTNGSPESTDPSWAPEAMGSYPESCGANGLSPLAEVQPEAMKNPPQPRLWAGTEIRGRLLSAADAYRGSDSFYYEDCAHFDRSRCREGLVIDSIPTCNPENLGSGVQQYPYLMVPSVRRGAWFNTMRTRRKGRSAILLTGRTTLSFGDSVFINTGGIPTTTTDLNTIVSQLRPVGSPINPLSELPSPRIKAGAAKLMKKTLRAYRNTGSFRLAARMSGNTVTEVKWLVKWKSVINNLMPFKDLKCGR
jgi:WD40 repeat protein